MPFPESAKIVCFASIFVSPEIGPRELEIIFRTAGEQGKIVCADMTKRKKNETAEELAEAFSYVDYLMPNDEEAMLITGKNTVEEAAESLRRAGVKTVVVKCGSKGCYVCGREKSFWMPAEKNVKCIDTTGAGDSFVAGFLHALAQGRNVRECAEYGNKCGANAVSVAGATDWTEKIGFPL